MNIYLNFNFVLGEMDRLKDTEGNLKLIDFLQSLMAGVCDATGNFNKLDVIISPNQDDLVTIIDSVPLPDRDKILASYGVSTTRAVFDVYGYYNKNEQNQNAGFIKDFQMRTEITPEMSSMITIGATANANIVGSDSTALSRMNAGIVDRYKIAIHDPETPQTEASKSLQERFSGPLNNFNVFVNDLSSRNYQTKPKWNLEAIEAYKSTIKDFLTYDQAKQSEKEDKGSPTIGFLPFNLSLKMEGLSGMKVYQKYTIDTSYLPTNYPNNLDFLIKSINHDISNNVWDTTIESIAVPNNVGGSGGAAVLTSTVDKASSRGGSSPVITPTSTLCPVASTTTAPPVNQPTSPVRSKAVATAYKYTFYNDGGHNQPKKHLCGKYTYTHAYNYVKALKNQTSSLKKGGELSAGGNANQSTYWNGLVSLGYTQTKLASGISKAAIIKLIKDTSYNYGDILVYWATGYLTDEGASQYGHTQMYVGGVVKGVTWTSDRYTNYDNASFVYNRKTYNCWNLILFRAPLA